LMPANSVKTISSTMAMAKILKPSMKISRKRNACYASEPYCNHVSDIAAQRIPVGRPLGM
jgi:hypothetical protein